MKKVAMDNLGLQSGKSVYKIQLPKILGSQKFMEAWDIKMRYAGNRSVKERLAIKMQRDADTAIGIMKS
ncbi:MAG: hypothetical protein H7833_11290 [Magnetococcus sp. DMHC-1]|nr:hypothetical protein [Magnetococcales bacterium]